MTQFLPPNLLALFAARDPIPYLPPATKLPHEKKQKGYDGVGAFLDSFEFPSETPPPTRVETREERAERRRRERAEQAAYRVEQEIALWEPTNNGRNTTGDPFKTLFVARINYDTSESKLRREFDGYGTIKKISMVYNKEDGKPRGYAFIEYEHERDMHSAYKHADGKKIDGKRVLVDVERARTVKGWLPRRLGGGLGGTRRGGADVNIKHSGREDNERERERYRLEQRERQDRGERRRRSTSRPRRRSTSRNRRRERPREEENESRKRRRSRSRSRRRSARDNRDAREPRDRESREGRDGRERDRKRARREKHKIKPEHVKIKEEPQDDYPEFSIAPIDVNVKQEERDEKYNPEDDMNNDEYNY